MTKRFIRSAALAAIIAVTGTVAGCSSDGDEDDFAYVERPVETLYAEAQTALDRKRFDEAIAYFDEVERQHPYSSWARRAMLMSAYVKYQTNDYEAAIEDLDRFISIHPGNKDAPYAYYLKAMCYYERIRDVGRDQSITRQALDSLEEVVRRYPDTEYARDATLKLDLTYDHIAGKEMDIGRWYLRKNQHVAAINRFNTVLQQYQTTSHTPEALHRIVESYLELGVVDEARRHAAVLGYNYPGSEWYEDTYRLFRRYDLAMEMPAQEVASRPAPEDTAARPRGAVAQPDGGMQDVMAPPDFDGPDGPVQAPQNPSPGGFDPEDELDPGAEFETGEQPGGGDFDSEDDAPSDQPLPPSPIEHK